MARQLPDNKLRIFVSSPGDVSVERRIARRVIERLQVEFEGRVELDPIFWEYLPMRATDTFQDQIPLASEAEIALFILWSRLGTPLPKEKFAREDGSEYGSGTEFEFELALTAHRSRNIPDILTYRKVARPVVELDLPDDQLQAMRQQRAALQAFVDKWFLQGTDGTLKAAFTDFEAPDEFEDKLEAHLRQLVRDYLPEQQTPQPQPAPEPVWCEGSPFRGLHAFGFEHEKIFCGRTRSVHEVVQALQRQKVRHRPLTVVLGMSGSGKSSLVMAGVVPVLTEPGVVEGVPAWRRAVMRPSEAEGSLFSALARVLLDQDEAEDLDSVAVESLATVLEHNPRVTASNVVGRLDAIGANACLALVVDQLEELFTESRFADQRAGFVRALGTLAESQRVWIVGTLRSDFYDRTASLPELVQLMEGDGQFHLLPPTSAAIGQMIRQPATLAGLSFEQSDTRGNLDDLLRDAAVKDTSALPLLEFALDELYQRRSENGKLTFDAYDLLGGVEGALAQRAESVFRTLSEEVQSVLPSVMRALTTVGEGETLTRRYAHHAELSSDAQKTFVEAFVQARLLVADATGIRIVHEALLTHWPRLVTWFEEDRAYLRTRARVQVAADRWEREQHDPAFLLAEGKPLAEGVDLLQQRRDELPDEVIRYIEASQQAAHERGDRERRRSRRILTAIGSALVVALILAGVSFALYRRAETALANEKEARGQVDTARERAEELAVLQAGLLEKVAKFGNIYVSKKQLDDAQETFASAHKVLERLVEDYPDNPRLQQIAKMSRYNVGKVDWLQLAAPEFERLVKRDPYVRSVFNTGKPDKTEHLTWLLSGYERAIKEWKELIELYPKKGYDVLLFDSHMRSAYILLKLGRFDELEAPMVEAEKLMQAARAGGRFDFQWFSRASGMKLVRDGWKVFLTDPDRDQPGFKQAERDRLHNMQPELVFELAIIAGALKDLGRNEEALELFLLGRGYADDFLAKKQSDNWKHLFGTAALYTMFGEFYQAEKETEKALEVWQAALAVLQRLRKMEPNNDKGRKGIIQLLDDIGIALYDARRYAEALVYYKRALAVTEERANAYSKDESAQQGVAYAQEQLGWTYEKLKQYEDALVSYRASLPIRKQVAEKNPSNKAFQRDLTNLEKWIKNAEAKVGSE